MRVCSLLLFLVLSAGQYALAGDIVKGIAGINLGADISSVSSIVLPNSEAVLWNQKYLTRVSVDDLVGFRSGYITYGNCKRPGKILRVKLNYEDDSSEFYQKIFNALKKRYGKNPEYRGGVFGNLKAWKWRLKDSAGNSVSLILQYYQGEEEEVTKGLSIRVALRDWMEDERVCYSERTRQEDEPDLVKQEKKMGLDWYLPY